MDYVYTLSILLEVHLPHTLSIITKNRLETTTYKPSSPS